MANLVSGAQAESFLASQGASPSSSRAKTAPRRDDRLFREEEIPLYDRISPVGVRILEAANDRRTGDIAEISLGDLKAAARVTSNQRLIVELRDLRQLMAANYAVVSNGSETRILLAQWGQATLMFRRIQTLASIVRPSGQHQDVTALIESFAA